MDNNSDRTDEHPLSEKQTNTSNSKLATLVAAVTDPKFPLPVLDANTSLIRYVLSFATLSTLIGGAVLGAWFLDVAMFQSSQPLLVMGSAFVALLGLFFFMGSVWIDWFELLLGYWWLSMPVGILAGLALVLNQEDSTSIGEKT